MATGHNELEPHLKELRRGSVLLACLLILRQPGYGYGLLERLGQVGVEVDANTLYPMLRRLEKQGLVRSWIGDATPQRGGRAKKHFALTEAGLGSVHDTRDALTALWSQLPQLS